VYIDPFVAGVLATFFAEAVVIVVWTITMVIRSNKNK